MEDLPDFESLVAQHRRELHAFCYRMLGSLQDAEDALQEALLNAWRGLAGFEGRSSFRSWLYRIASNACLRLIEQRPKRVLPESYGPPTSGLDVAAFVEGPLWLEPFPEDAGARLEQKQSVELAFIAALQHLPATQRAILILSDVLGFSAVEVAQLLDTTVPSTNSALQRARQTVAERIPAKSQQTTLRELGEPAERVLIEQFVRAWEGQDLAALVKLLTKDVKFTMPPIPTWFDGQEAVSRFLAERVFATAWRLTPTRASSQLAFACYQGPDFKLGALNVITLRGDRISHLTGFLDPATHAHFFPAHR